MGCCVDILGKRVATYRCPYRVSGVVVGETYNLLYIYTGGKVVKIPKAACRLYVYELQKLVSGACLVGYRDRRLFSCRA